MGIQIRQRQPATIDKRDRKILTLLSYNPRSTYTDLAKVSNLSKNAARYRVERLFKERIIYYIRPVTNYAKLGFAEYELFIKCNLVGKKKEEFERAIKKNEHIVWAVAVFGAYDYYIEIICKTAFELDQSIEELSSIAGKSMQKFSAIIATERLKIKQLVPELEEDIPEHYKSPPPKPNTSPTKLDDLDKNILALLNEDGRAGLLELANKLNVTLQTIGNRLRKLVSDTTIEKFITIFGDMPLGYNVHIVLLKTKYLSRADKENLRDYFAKEKHTKLVLRLTNVNGIMISTSTSKPREFEDLIIDLKNAFPDLIEDVEMMNILYELKLNFFPKGLF